MAPAKYNLSGIQLPALLYHARVDSILKFSHDR